MDLQTQCINEVNRMTDNDGIPLIQKAIIWCGLALNTNNSWKIPQLFQHLQDIIERHPSEFHGNLVE